MESIRTSVWDQSVVIISGSFPALLKEQKLSHVYFAPKWDLILPERQIAIVPWK